MSGFGDSLTTVGTTQLHPLGTIVVEPATQGGTRANQGEKHWIYVGNNSAGILTAGLACVRTPGGAGVYRVSPAPVAAATGAFAIVGVAQITIPVGSYGFVLRRGVGTVRSAVGIAAGLAVIPDPTVLGNAIAGAVADNNIGTCLAVALAGALATCHFDCQG